MMPGFFSKSDLQPKTPRLPIHPRCGTCGLGGANASVYQSSENGCLIIGSACASDKKPNRIGKKEVREAMRGIMHSCGSSYAECGKVNAIACLTYEKTTPQQVASCRPCVIRAIKEMRPRVIIPIGSNAISSVLGYTFKTSPGGLGQWPGYTIPDQRTNAWICPTWDPGTFEEKEKAGHVVFEKHITAACEKIGEKTRPWAAVPDWEKRIDVELSPSRVCAWLRDMPKGSPIAFDYEATMLKPDFPDAEIVSCAVRCGSKTIAFPWHGSAIDAMADVLFSDRPKIAANAKFEDRWTREFLGAPVNNLVWDTMLAAHILDNRQGTHGAKFQAYALHGFAAYDSHIHPYLVGGGGGACNRIRDLDMRDLLRYNGLDSFVEYEIARTQVRKLGYESQFTERL